MNVYGVVDSRLDEAIELFLRREDAEQVVREWDLDEPAEAGLLPAYFLRSPRSMSVVGWRERVPETVAGNSSGPYYAFDETGVDVWCRCGHHLLGRPLTAGEMNVVGRSDLHGYARMKYVLAELGHFTYVLAELGHFTCPVCGYSWEDARKGKPSG